MNAGSHQTRGVQAEQREQEAGRPEPRGGNGPAAAFSSHPSNKYSI